MTRNRRSGQTALGAGTVKGVPAIPPPRDGTEYWAPGQAERPGYALIPTLTRAGLIWPDTYDPAIHGEPAERSGVKAALDPEWW